MSKEYLEFIHQKSQLDGNFGFEPNILPDFLFPFQADIVSWALRKGRGAIFADCGLGKTFMELVWAMNVYHKTGKPILILTPLAVGAQFVAEAAKMDIEASRSNDGTIPAPITITNYQRLHYFNPDKFGGIVCDESSILKNFDGTTKAAITEFARTLKYRLLGTATAAPNDYTELGTSSEALGYLGYMDMLGRFFTNRQRTTHQYHGKYRMKNNDKWRFKGHAEQAFWRWVSSWAKSLRRPSDLGYDDNGFILPPLNIVTHEVAPQTKPDGMLFNLPAVNWYEQRAEAKRTTPERCEKVAELVNATDEPFVVWCHRNAEADLLESLIPDAQQVSGSDNDEQKESKFEAFGNQQLRVLITKPKIGAWGLNWQHCNRVAYFPSDSYEQYYQAVRRCWRFGQKRDVTVDIVSTPGQRFILENMQAKEKAAAEMFTQLVAHMNDAADIQRKFDYNNRMEVPSWL